MVACSVPESLATGRIVVFTSNRFLARTVEEKVRQEGLAERMTSGMLCVEGETVHWMALPRAAARTALAKPHYAACR